MLRRLVTKTQGNYEEGLAACDLITEICEELLPIPCEDCRLHRCQAQATQRHARALPSFSAFPHPSNDLRVALVTCLDVTIVPRVNERQPEAKEKQKNTESQNL
ncbi:hypothetical protein BaRGS_00012229 [Batillaria attramentaria]|uniref:Uncharacterized protein n=1 Tax=Batillaria attramentaria TaxID=370345 RepID=A0ABD0LAM5_9CAEN